MKILIVGAGPAGSSAAYNASKQGHEVHVFEKNEVPVVKPCGEGIFKDAFDYVDLKPNSDFIENHVSMADIYFRDEYVATGSLSNSSKRAFVVNKRKMIKTILNNAESNGAIIHWKAKVIDVDPVKGRIRVGNKFYEGDLIILADGTGTLARRFLDFKRVVLAPAITYMNAKIDKPIDPDKAIFNFYDDGYSWIFPKSEKIVNVGVGSLSMNLKKKLTEILKKWKITPKTNLKAAPVPISGLIQKLEFGKVRVIGDAAGMVMPHTGEGIRFAFLAGKMAVDDNFEKFMRSELEPRFNRSLRMLDLFMKGLNQDEKIVIIKKLTGDIDAIIDGERPKMRTLLKLGPRLLYKLTRVIKHTEK